MKLWLVCFLILFFGAEAVQWVNHLPWMGSVELSLPLTIAGGVGLAIASNYRSRPSLGPPGVPPLPSPPPSPKAAAAPVSTSKASPKADTISFEIKKPQAKG
ncbi:hypothetical protein PGN35_001870 [Nodosilinea sp. PGN35]|uniref:hypothetical protein n=1 Tax=Nodosilinea sp. PGN35 TaxID=3020489 RepID=UPI0023B32347|nr:hypothetical protein [Nodosilinea sp. TSF1-S3]MDF0368846.1 hypothetical protein [Nodosilinea sp. TSF1-S3]